MNMKLLFLCIGITANAFAADPASLAPQAQPLAVSTQTNSVVKPAMRRLPAPTISETSVTRRADGSLTMNCVQKPNPKLKQSVVTPQSTKLPQS
jgi:hypothetical protein